MHEADGSRLDIQLRHYIESVREGMDILADILASCEELDGLVRVNDAETIVRILTEVGNASNLNAMSLSAEFSGQMERNRRDAERVNNEVPERIDGRTKCPVCFIEASRHPSEIDGPFADVPTVKRLCDGRLIKV